MFQTSDMHHTTTSSGVHYRLIQKNVGSFFREFQEAMFYMSKHLIVFLIKDLQNV